MKNETNELHQAPAGETEALEIVGCLMDDPIMLVTQHLRIMAAKEAEIAAFEQAGMGDEGSAAQKSFWAGYEAAKLDEQCSNIRTAWNGFKSSEQFSRLNASRDGAAALAGQQHSPKPVGDSQCENYGGPDGVWLNECLTPRIANTSRDVVPAPSADDGMIKMSRELLESILRTMEFVCADTTEMVELRAILSQTSGVEHE